MRFAQTNIYEFLMILRIKKNYFPKSINQLIFVTKTDCVLFVEETICICSLFNNAFLVT
jgi:hypothetical protein